MRREKSELAGCLIHILLAALTLWGVGWSFYRHSRADGIVAIVAWPYAWYRGVAAIWEDPKWLDNYDEKVKTIGYLVVADFSSDDASRSASISRLERSSSEWIAILPETELSRLRSSVKALSDARVLCFKHVAASISSGSDPCAHPELKDIESRIADSRELVEVWEGYKREVHAFSQVAAANFNARSASLSEPDRSALLGVLLQQNTAGTSKLEKDLEQLEQRLFGAKGDN